MEIVIKDNGKMIKDMGMVLKNGQMEIYIKEIGIMI
jgi:hypothetical protein